MTTKNIKYDPIDYIESAYNTSEIELMKYTADTGFLAPTVLNVSQTANIWTRLSRVIYSIFDWQSYDKLSQQPTYSNDNNV